MDLQECGRTRQSCLPPSARRRTPKTTHKKNPKNGSKLLIFHEELYKSIGQQGRDSGTGGHGFMSLNDRMHLLNEKDHTSVRKPGRRLVLVLHKSVTETSIWGVCEGIGLLALDISHKSTDCSYQQRLIYRNANIPQFSDFS